MKLFIAMMTILLLISVSQASSNFRVDISHPDGRMWLGYFKTLSEANDWLSIQMKGRDHDGATAVVTDETALRLAEKADKQTKRLLLTELRNWNCQTLPAGYVKKLCEYQKYK